jgi:hypothetical protein
VFWEEHNYDSSRTGYFSYAHATRTPQPPGAAAGRCRISHIGAAAHSEISVPWTGSYLHPLEQVLHAPANALDQVRPAHPIRTILGGLLSRSGHPRYSGTHVGRRVLPYTQDCAVLYTCSGSVAP